MPLTSEPTSPATDSTNQPAAFITRVHRVRYQVADVNRAVAFYTQHLGFTLKHAQPPAFANVVRGAEVKSKLTTLAGSLPVAPCTPPEVGGTPAQPAPAPKSRTNCELLLWSTPHGFLKAAMHNHASTSPDKGNAIVSFTAHGINKMVGTLDAAHHVTRVQAWIEPSIVGDMLVETEYRDYEDFGGVIFPSHIVQKQDGFPSLDLTVSAVTAKAAR